METLPQLERTSYDWLVVGTGIEESMLAAHFAKVLKKKLLVLDLDRNYSCNTRSMNFREFHQFAEQLTSQSLEQGFRKTKVFQGVGPQYPINTTFANLINSGHDFKYFNIDIQPKLLYSTSPTVTLMQKADMDQYMDFRAITNQYYFDRETNKFQITPTSKSQIFNCPFLSLIEKKKMFQLIHTLVKISNYHQGYTVDQNSTDEFDKDFNLDEKTLTIFNQHKQGLAYPFVVTLLGKTSPDSLNKIINIFFCSLCFVDDIQQVTTLDFLKRLVKFIRSLGVHTANAFLYTNYGTGDIAQGFSRIAAVYGSDYVLNEKIQITKIEKGEFEYAPQPESRPVPYDQKEPESEQETQSNQQQEPQIAKAKYMVHTNIAQDPLYINEGIILSNDLIQSLPTIYERVSVEKQHQKNVQLRITLITTKNVNPNMKQELEEFNSMDFGDTEHPKPTNPIIYIIPPKSAGLDLDHPLYIFRTDNCSFTTHKNYEAFFLKTKMEAQDDQVVNKLLDYVRRIDIDTEFSSFNYICYACPFYQYQQGDVLKDDDDIIVCKEETFDIDLDSISESYLARVEKPLEKEPLQEQGSRIDGLLEQIMKIQK